ncbi:tetratricopeptide repeat protein [Propionivibrio sp.]|uniref:tetratricopeptide repeat protein n=1 Tax=Propionivibrio sp. TaxID=2212460 RepID=UPI003BEFC06C
MQLISLPAAITLTEWSERTFWRKFADGSMARKIVNGKTMIPLDLIKPHLCLPFEPEDFLVLKSADSGDAEAQNEMALIFLSSDKPKCAIYWLEQAAKQGYADAMNLLSQCYMRGNGVPKDENTGVIWLAKAAAHGHLISQRQMDGLRTKLPPTEIIAFKRGS